MLSLLNISLAVYFLPSVFQHYRVFEYNIYCNCVSAECDTYKSTNIKSFMDAVKTALSNETYLSDVLDIWTVRRESIMEGQNQKINVHHYLHSCPAPSSLLHFQYVLRMIEFSALHCVLLGHVLLNYPTRVRFNTYIRYIICEEIAQIFITRNCYAWRDGVIHYM